MKRDIVGYSSTFESGRQVHDYRESGILLCHLHCGCFLFCSLRRETPDNVDDLTS